MILERKNNWLDIYDKNIHSQHGEDGKIEKILEVIGCTHSGWCVEFGAWDGIYNSNTYNLIENKKFNAVLIEGSFEKFYELKKNMQNFPVTCIRELVGFGENNNLDKLLKSTRIPNSFDVLVIDIDGNDYHVWKSITAYRPKLIVIEFNPTIPDEIEFIQEPMSHLNHGASLKSLIFLGKEKKYELVATTLNNAFFVDEKYYSNFNITDNSIEKLHTNKSRITYLFSGYDGTIFIRGYGELDLHGIRFNEKKMQLIPKILRGFSDSSGGLSIAKKLVKKAYSSMKKRGLI